MIASWGPITSLIDKESITKDKLGKWIAFKITKEEKTILMIQLYRIPISTPQGVYNVLTQQNSIEKNVKSAAEYRKEILMEIKQYVMQQNNISDVLIMGDQNQDVTTREIKDFFQELKV